MYFGWIVSGLDLNLWVWYNIDLWVWWFWVGCGLGLWWVLYFEWVGGSDVSRFGWVLGGLGWFGLVGFGGFGLVGFGGFGGLFGILGVDGWVSCDVLCWVGLV